MPAPPRHGEGLGCDTAAAPPALLERIGTPVPFTTAQVTAYFARNHIDLGQVATGLAARSAPRLRFFVIHDTSSPEIPSTGVEFPLGVDEGTYSGSGLSGWAGVARKVNLIIARNGQSRLFQQWGAARRSPVTKIEEGGRIATARPLFVHVENIQPRLRPPGTWGWKAPQPGFTAAQEQRLALAYIVASLIAGRWLTPAYHFNIDQGLPDGHDDPQHADLASWVTRIVAIEKETVTPRG